MNLFALSGILIAVSCFLLSLLVFKSNPKKRINQVSALSSLCVAIWGVGIYVIAQTVDKNLAFLYWRLAHIGVIFIPVFFVHFVYKLLEINRKKILLIIYALGLFFLAADATPWFISNMRWAFGQFYYDSPPGIIYLFFIFFFVALAAYGNYELIKAYFKETSTKRHQIKYYLIGSLIAYAGGSTAFFPVFGIDIYPALSIAIIFYPLMTTYAIIRYRLMDIRIIVRKSTVYLILAGFVYACFHGVVWVLQDMFGSIYLREAMIFGIFLAFAFVFAFIWFEKLVKFLANKYFFGSLYNYQKTLSDVTKKLTTVVNLEELAVLIIETIVKTMQIDRAALLLRKDKGFTVVKLIGFEKKNGLSLVQDDVLTEHLEKNQKALVYEELGFIGLDNLKDNMKQIRADLVLPLIFKDKLIGLIILGSKISRDAYTKEDIELLETLARQAGIAVENAQLYYHMDEKVAEQTKDIQELLNVKSEFLNLASHQLRTPVSGIRAALSMITEGSTTPEQTKDFLQDCYVNTNRLVVIIKDILDAQSIAGRGLKLAKTACQIEDIIRESITMFKVMADKKGLYLNVEKPKEKLPLLNADKSRLRGALDDLIDNAIHYTLKGGVTIKLKIENLKPASPAGRLKIIIQDTGIGIEKEEFPLLFQKFSRGRGGRTLNVNSSGLGLYIAKHIIELHNGTIDVFSEGKDKGTRFTISLPIES